MLFRAPRPEPRIPARDSPLHTACVFVRLRPLARASADFVVGKTTVCRIFSCKELEASSRQLRAVSLVERRCRGELHSISFCGRLRPPGFGAQPSLTRPRGLSTYLRAPAGRPSLVLLAIEGWLPNRSSLRSASCQAERLGSEGWRIPGSNR